MRPLIPRDGSPTVTVPYRPAADPDLRCSCHLGWNAFCWSKDLARGTGVWGGAPLGASAPNDDRSGGWAESDRVAEGFETVHEATGLGVGVGVLVEPVGAEVLVGSAVAEDVVRGDDDRVGDGDDGFVRPSSAGEAAVLSA